MPDGGVWNDDKYQDMRMLHTAPYTQLLVDKQYTTEPYIYALLPFEITHTSLVLQYNYYYNSTAQ